MMGVSLVALNVGLAAGLTVSSAHAVDTRTVINGNGGGGVILLDDAQATNLSGVLPDATDGILESGGFDADATISVTGTVIQGSSGAYTITDSIFTNFATQGGAGSGGGGGLGGVILVDQGAALTVNNTDFIRNTVVGGTGGSGASLEVGAYSVGLGDINLPVPSITAINPDLDLGRNNGTYTISTLTLTSANRGLEPGMRITLPGTGTVVQITDISNDGKMLSFAPTTVPSSLIVGPGTDVSSSPQSSVRNQIDFDGAGNLGQVKVGSLLVLDGGKTSLRVQAVDTGSDIVTFDSDLSNAQWSSVTGQNPDIAFFNLTSLDISQIKSVSGDTLVFPGEDDTLRPGMVLSGGELSGSVTVTSVDVVTTNGVTETQVRVSGNLPSNLTKFDAKFEQVQAGSDKVWVTDSKLFAGMKVSGSGVPDGITVQSINTDGSITLSGSLPAGVKPSSLTFSGLASAAGSTLTFVDSSLVSTVAPGMLVTGAGIPEGTKVLSVSGSQVVVELPSGAALGTVSGVTFASATSLGGTLNGIEQTVTGSAGRNGNDAPSSNTIVGDGEGIDGKDGDKGTAGVVGAGGRGGKGGNGSAGLSWNPEQVKAVADASISAVLLTSEAAAALSSFPPDVGESVVVGLEATQAWVTFGFETGKLQDWSDNYKAGNNAAGGNGGDGNSGGDGSEFFGGGVGGNGGNGADPGNETLGDGGDGGEGGEGGKGGFGGGGGMGGAGGTAGSGVSNSAGDAGDGGKGGFAGGQGSNGDGEEGGGGAGFGGAIFVRDGGKLEITGTSTFTENRAEGGSSINGGQAGNAAGADLFMMKGSTVIIQPGVTVLQGGGSADNVVTFNGTIGDNSRESFDEATFARGSGASLTIGQGLVVFNGHNTYTGQTIMQGGVLDADDGIGLNHYSNLNFAGGGRTDGTGSASLAANANAGVLLTSGYFGRQVGGLGPQVQWTGSGGFAAKGGDVIVNLGSLPNPMKLTWGSTPGFFSNASAPGDKAALVFGSTHADARVQWLNPIDLGALDRQVLVTDNGNTQLDDDYAVMAGAISGTGGLIVGEVGSNFWDGQLFLAGKNTFTGDISLRSGTLGVVAGATLASGVDLDVADGAKFLVSGTNVVLGELSGGAGSTVTVDGGNLTVSENSPGFDGLVTVHDDAALYLTDAGNIPNATIGLAGLFDISGITAASTSVADLFGDGTIALGTKRLAVSDAQGGTFSGQITGTGAFGVSGGTLFLDFPDSQLITANIFAETGGKLSLTGGTINTTSSSQSALSVINGGVIDVKDSTLITGPSQPTASVRFDELFVDTEDPTDNLTGNPAYIRLGDGVDVQNGGPLLVVERDTTVNPTALTGNVTFIIDNGQTISGDILDEDADRTTPGGSTTVYLGDDVHWTGKAVAGDFWALGGSSAHFNSGSLLDNLHAATGAQVDLSGNVVILGRFTIDANGVVAPGSSPGTYNPNSMESNNGNETLWIKFGQANPQPGAGNDYSQINVAGDFGGLNGNGPGVLAITLQRWQSTQSTPLGNLAALELLRIGGTENPGSNVYLAERFTQYGHELLLDKRVNVAVDNTVVAGTSVIGNPTEDAYFDNDQITVYGLRAIVQDETYGLATLAGTVHQTGLETFGSFLERRGSGPLEDVWGRASYVHTEVDDTIDSTQDLAYGQYGADLVNLGEVRGGVLGSYSASQSGIATETGTNTLQGNVFSGGTYGTWSNGSAYLDAVGQFGYGDWTFSPTAASQLTIQSYTGLAALEAGVRIGDDQVSVTPWGQMVYQATYFDGLKSDWVGDAEFTDNSSLYLRGGVRAEAKFGGFAPYLDLGMSYNTEDVKTVTVDGFDLSTGMGGTRYEVAAGFQADVSDTAVIWSSLKGAYAQDSDTVGVVGYQGQAGMRVTW